MKTFEPVIKWSGSKRSIAHNIVDFMPRDIDTYYEPFFGSGAVLREVVDRVEHGRMAVRRFVCSDVNKELMATWRVVRDNPAAIMKKYREMYGVFAGKDHDEKLAIYGEACREFNRKKLAGDLDEDCCCLFFWIRRTCYNGLVRYNRSGEFNTSCHFSRDGIVPEKLEPVLADWNRVLSKHDVGLIASSYEASAAGASQDDFVYCDPPYERTKGMYREGEFDKGAFFRWLSGIPRFSLSYDGRTDVADYTSDLPNKIRGLNHVYINSGSSSFSRLKKNDVGVMESLYLKNGW